MANSKKTLIITGLADKLFSQSSFLKNKNEDLLIIPASLESLKSQPYGCTVRNIILAVYSENVDKMYFIGEKNSGIHKVNGEEMVLKIQQSGVSNEVIQAIECMKVVEGSLSSWLTESEEIEKVIIETIQMMKTHPLLPKTVSIYGGVINKETGEFEKVCY